MTKKRPERTARRAAEREARRLVRDRERLASLAAGGSRERPISVESVAVIEVRALAQPCPQCEGAYHLIEHRAHPAGLREVLVSCQRCHVGRSAWFRLTSNAAN